MLWRAWREVARNAGVAGVDGVSIQAIEEEGVEAFLRELQQELVEGCYRPQPVRRVTILKSSGGERHLGVPTVRDRVVQTAVKLVVEPIFEADFADCSFGFRPKRSAHQARERIRTGLRQGRRWVVDADIRGFFDHLDHGLVLALVRERVSDRRIVKLLAGWLRAGFLRKGADLPDAVYGHSVVREHDRIVRSNFSCLAVWSAKARISAFAPLRAMTKTSVARTMPTRSMLLLTVVLPSRYRSIVSR